VRFFRWEIAPRIKRARHAAPLRKGPGKRRPTEEGGTPLRLAIQFIVSAAGAEFSKKSENCAHSRLESLNLGQLGRDLKRGKICNNIA